MVASALRAGLEPQPALTIYESPAAYQQNFANLSAEVTRRNLERTGREAAHRSADRRPDSQSRERSEPPDQN